MPVTFARTNEFIDEMVNLANEGKGDHSAEGLFVPPREEIEDFVDDSSTEDDREPQLINFDSSQAAQSFASASLPTT